MKTRLLIRDRTNKELPNSIQVTSILKVAVWPTDVMKYGFRLLTRRQDVVNVRSQRNLFVLEISNLKVES